MSGPPSSLGHLRTLSHHPQSTVIDETVTKTRQTSTLTDKSFNFPTNHHAPPPPTFTPLQQSRSYRMNTDLPNDHERTEQEEEEEEGGGGRGGGDDEEEANDFAELRFLPSTTTSVVTTTTTLTTHFAPLKIPKSSGRVQPQSEGGRGRRGSSSSFSANLRGLGELVEWEEAQHRDGGTFNKGDERRKGKGREELNVKEYPLSQTEWTSCGLGSFKLELGELKARFEHDPTSSASSAPSHPNLLRSGTGEDTRRQENRIDRKGKGKGKEAVVPGSTTRRTTTRTSPGPPPRKRPRAETNDGDDGLEGQARISLPSPGQSPASPVSTPSAQHSNDSAPPARAQQEDFDRRRREQSQARSVETPPLQSFDLGQSASISALLSLPDLVDSFDQLSPSLQSYLIFNLLRRSSIPVLQTVANVISPALRRDFLSDLPPELSVQVLGYLDPTTLCRASLVCKNWRRLVDGEWRIWKKMMDLDGLWIGDGSEEKEAREIVTGKKENWFLERWKAGVWDQKKTSTWNGKVDPDNLYFDGSQPRAPRRPSLFTTSVRPASPSSSRDVSPEAAVISVPDSQPHSVHPYKLLYRRRWLARRNWKQSEPKRTTFTSTTATTNVVTCLQFDEEKIVSASDDADHSIHVFDTQSGSERAELRGHEGGVWALQYIGNVLVSGSTDRSVRVWDLDSAKCTHEFLGHTSTVRCLQIVEPVNVNPDPNGEPIWEPPHPLVVTGSRDWSLRVWKLPFAGKDREYHPAVPMSPTEGEEAAEGGVPVPEPTDNPYYERQLSGHRHAVRAVAAAGRTVVSGSYDHSVRVWDLLTGDCLHVLEGHTQKVYSVVLDHHRRQCASGSMDGTVRLWSTETGEQLHSLDGHSSLVGLLGLSRRCLVSAAADWTLRIWDPESGQCRHALNAHQGAITCFQHDEYKIVSGSDGTLKMWDTQTGEFVRDLLANLTGVWQVAFNQRYCIAAVQRNGSSEFELLDFGSVSEDEIQSHLEEEATRSTALTVSPPTPTKSYEPSLRRPSPTIAHDEDDFDMDMNDDHPLPFSTTSSSSSGAARRRSSAADDHATSGSNVGSSSSSKPPALRGPSHLSRFRSTDSARTTTPDHVNDSEPSTSSSLARAAAAGGGGGGGTLRRIDSSRTLPSFSRNTSNDSPTVQGRGGRNSASMEVDGEDDEEEEVEEIATSRTSRREEEEEERSE